MKKEDYQRLILIQNVAMIACLVLFAVILTIVTYKIAAKQPCPNEVILNPVDTTAQTPNNKTQRFKTYTGDQVNIVTLYPTDICKR